MNDGGLSHAGQGDDRPSLARAELHLGSDCRGPKTRERGNRTAEYQNRPGVRCNRLLPLCGIIYQLPTMTKLGRNEKNVHSPARRIRVDRLQVQQEAILRDSPHQDRRYAELRPLSCRWKDRFREGQRIADMWSVD